MITFKSNNSSITETLVIGGSDSTPTFSSFGGYGPFPTYSIAREEIFADDGTYLTSKYTININGAAAIKPEDTSDILTKGKRQSLVQGEAIIKLQFNRNKWPMLGDGVLSIKNYAENDNNIIKFYDARLISVNIPEQNEESAGIHYTEYAFVFEAYDVDGSNLSTNLVSSVQESWELSENDGQYCFNNSDIDTYVYKTFTLKHNLSAVGIRRYNSSTTIASEAWYEAASWVKSRLINQPNEIHISSHINNQIIGPKFVPFYMNSSVKKDDLKIDLTRGGVKYKAYNHSRNASVDISGAGYNLTDTWLIALESSKAIHQIECQLDNPIDAPFTTVNVTDNITGLNTATFISNNNDAFSNAESELTKILSESKLFSFAEKVYNSTSTFLKPNRALRNLIISKTISYNRTTGNINLSVTYNNEQILSDPIKVSSETIDINYDNNNLETAKIAIIPVIGRPRGPVIQSFSTNKERKISININLIIKPEHRTVSPPRDIANNILNTYKPDNSYVNSRSEQWNKKTGAYNLSIEWIYR